MSVASSVTLTMGLVGLSLAISGVVLVARRSRVAGSLVCAAGLLAVTASALRSAGHGGLGEVLVLVAGVGLLPPALAAYPRLRHQHPVDVVAFVALAGAVPGVLLVAHLPQVVGYVAFLVLVAHTWWRIETSEGPERATLLWMAVTVSTMTLVIGVVSFALEGSEMWLALSFLLAVALGPLLVLGVSRPDVVDVRGLVVRISVFCCALLVHVSLFVLLVGLLDAWGITSPSVGTLGLLGGLAAAAFRPVQVVMRGVVDALLFGERPDPLDAATALAGRVGDDLADTLRVVREALVLPYAALLVADQVVASSGTEPTHVRTLDLSGAGSLVVGLRPGDLSLSSGDQNVLGLVVPLLVQNLRARALTTQLQESRERTISVVEEERRRLRRDLHDGLGPRLSGIAFSTDAVRNLLRSDPDQADGLLVALRAETSVAIADIRRLVYAMRPPALDELGLVPALRQQTLGLRGPSGAPLSVTLDAPARLPGLSAAVEVAAYRIVMEALTNVARHTTSRAAVVRLCHQGDGLVIEVTDTGTCAEPWTAGVGLASMRERAVELGGTLDAGPGPSGSRVRALLPIS